MSEKLHEILAVEPNVKQKADVILKEGIHTFTKKQNLFNGQIRNYKPKDDDGDQFPPESQILVSTVPEKLKYVFEALADKANLIATKEQTNLEAKAELNIGGNVVTLSATTLLALEKEIKSWRNLLIVAPTLEPDVTWEFDTNNDYFKSPVLDTLKMKKVQAPVVLYEATEKHPAQVELITKDVMIGTWETQKTSGAISSSVKSEILARLDNLEIEVKRARQRANTQEISRSTVGTMLTNFILNGSGTNDA